MSGGSKWQALEEGEDEESLPPAPPPTRRSMSGAKWQALDADEDIVCEEDLSLSLPVTTDSPRVAIKLMCVTVAPSVYTMRRVGFFVAMIVALCSGTQYSFGAYSHSLRTYLALSQSQIATVGASLNAGSYVLQPVSGILVDRLGPRRIGLLAASLVSSSLLVMFICLLCYPHSDPSGPPTPFFVLLLLDVALFITGFASGMGYLFALSTNAMNYSSGDRGKVIGALASMNGLSATTVTMIYRVAFTDHLPYLFLAMAVWIGAVYVLGSVFVRIYPNLVLATPVIASNDDHEKVKLEMESKVEPSYTQPETALASHDHPIPSEGPHRLSHSQEAYGESLTCVDIFKNFIGLIKSTPFRLLFVSFFLGTGTSLFIINSIGSIVDSLEGSVATSSQEDRETMTAVVVVSLSIANCCGRLIAGYIADSTTSRRGVIFTGAFAVLAVGQAGAACCFRGWHLIPVVIVIGLGYGALWFCMPFIISDTAIFSSRTFAQNLGFVVVSAAAGSIVFNKTSAWIYGFDRCVGQSCFQPTCIICSVACVIACLISIRLTPFTSPCLSVATATHHAH